MPDDRPTFGSLFAGIGGIDLGLERSGWECRFQVEWDPFCQRVLAKHWPDVPRYGDIAAVDWTGVERVDLLAGGFPCQPVSVAGKGLAQADSRWLWPEFERAIRALRPRLVLVENVPGLFSRGMGDVLGDLAELGYDAEWQVVSAADAGAPHLRKRVWVVATDTLGGELRDEPGWCGRTNGTDAAEPRHDGQAWTVADAEGEPVGAGLRDGGASTIGRRRSGNGGRQNSLAESGGEGLSVPERQVLLGQGWWEEGRAATERGWWATEPDVGRVAHGVPARVDRLRALGNAVVPQVVEMIGRQLLPAIAARDGGET